MLALTVHLALRSGLNEASKFIGFCGSSVSRRLLIGLPEFCSHSEDAQEERVGGAGGGGGSNAKHSFVPS